MTAAIQLAAVKERPILYSGPMIRALIARRKTQTRRIVTDERALAILSTYEGTMSWAIENMPAVLPRCPYGRPGDRLWVRETWGLHGYYDMTDWCRDSLVGASDSYLGSWSLGYRADFENDVEGAFWRPSIHMPRWASRITLAVTSVRVERLQDISEEDIRSEGIPLERDPITGVFAVRGEWLREERGIEPSARYVDPKIAWQMLWDSINGERASWASNPFVWVVSFSVVEVHGG